MEVQINLSLGRRASSSCYSSRRGGRRVAQNAWRGRARVNEYANKRHRRIYSFWGSRPPADHTYTSYFSNFFTRRDRRLYGTQNRACEPSN